MQIKKEQPAYLLKAVLSEERKADYTKSSGKARIREGSFCQRWFVKKEKKKKGISNKNHAETLRALLESSELQPVILSKLQCRV